jgi:hypothetical protein
MKVRTVAALACCVVLSQAPALTQPADPVIASWISGGATFLELKYDGRHAVTGTAIWRNDGQVVRTPITSGAYDSKTRKLRLEGAGKRRGGEFTFARVAPGQRTPEQINAAFDEHKGDFDYLLGDWQFTADSKEHGKYGGYWSAVKLAEGQILDEFRVTGDKGETYYVTTSLRNYNKFADRWELIGADAGTGMQDFGTARRVGSEMHIEQKFAVASGQTAIMKIRYYNIEKDRFSWTGDRSTDGGKTWVKNHLQIEARRIGPPRSLGPLAAPKDKTSVP